MLDLSCKTIISLPLCFAVEESSFLLSRFAFLMDLDIHSSPGPELVLWTLILSICLPSVMIISVVTIVFLSLERIHINDRMLSGYLAEQWGGFVQTLSSFEVLEF